MEAQMQRPYGHAYEGDPQNVGLHSGVESKDEQHHDKKKSVLKKVKSKAKKLKDTSKKHGHGHEHNYHGHGHGPEYHHDEHEYEDEEEDDDDDDGMEKDPEVYGAPMYDSTAVKGAVPGKDFNVEKRMPNLEEPSVVGEDRYDHSIITELPVRPFGKWDEENSGQGWDQNLGRQMGMHTADPSRNVGQPREKVGLGELAGLEDDPHAPKDLFGAIPPPNYHSKVVDPTGDGGEEANVDPLIESLDKMKVGDEPEEQRGQKVYTSSHDQFAPESHPTKFTSQENPDEVPKRYNPDRPQDLPRDTLAIRSPEARVYVEKISSATSAIADKAVSAKNVVASKLGYGGIEEAKTHGRESGVGAGKSASSATTEYADKIAATVTEKLAPLYEKVADAGSSVTSKVQGIAKGQEGSEKVPVNGVSVKEYLAEKFRPTDEDKALSGLMTDAFHKRKAQPQQGEGEEAKPMGKVTEFEEIKRRLDTGNEEQNEGAGSTVANTMSAAGGDLSHTSQGLTGDSHAGGQAMPTSVGGGGDVGIGQESAGEPRLQESGK